MQTNFWAKSDLKCTYIKWDMNSNYMDVSESHGQFACSNIYLSLMQLYVSLIHPNLYAHFFSWKHDYISFIHTEIVDEPLFFRKIILMYNIKQKQMSDIVITLLDLSTISTDDPHGPSLRAWWFYSLKNISETGLCPTFVDISLYVISCYIWNRLCEHRPSVYGLSQLDTTLQLMQRRTPWA